MDLDRNPFTIANAAAEEIRALNHRTLNDEKAYPYPSSVSDTAGALNSAAERLPQSLGQMRDALTRLADAGHIKIVVRPNEQPADLAARMQEVAEFFLAAEVAAGALATALATVMSLTSDMAYGGPYDDEDDN